MTDEFDTRRDVKSAPLHAPEQKKKLKKKSKKKVNERFCFVITKHKSDSWADDLYACGRIADLNRVYH